MSVYKVSKLKNCDLLVTGDVEHFEILLALFQVMVEPG